jgi:hypothetical protein
MWCTKVVSEMGYVEYIVFVEHRGKLPVRWLPLIAHNVLNSPLPTESWQQIIAILSSKAELSTYVLDLMKKMDIHYRAPPMPIDLNVAGASGLNGLMAGASGSPHLPDLSYRGRAATFTYSPPGAGSVGE